MKLAIAYGKDDPAANNIIENLKEISFLPQVPLIKLRKHPIYADNLNKKNYPELKQVDFIVIASTHRSEKGEKSLSVHAPGNWRNADLGGKPSKLSMTSALVLKYLFKELNKNAKPLGDKYRVTLECTHHGPSIDIPCCFIEIGSGEEQWEDKSAGKAIAKTIASLPDYKESNSKVAIGIGGPHYCPGFNKIQLDSEYAVGHILPQYAFPVTLPIVKEAIEKTKETTSCIIIDWKGCKSEERQKIIKLAEQLGLEYRRTNEIGKKEAHELS